MTDTPEQTPAQLHLQKVLDAIHALPPEEHTAVFQAAATAIQIAASLGEVNGRLVVALVSAEVCAHGFKESEEGVVVIEQPKQIIKPH